MDFIFKMENTVVKDSKIFSGVKGQMDNAKITFKGGEISNTELFTNLDIPSFCSQIADDESYSQMTPQEKESIHKILQERNNKGKFLSKLFQHLISFSEGVAVNVVAACLTK